nr:MAG TPA: hypothetical protein [Caudoviricetes sp.]
MVRTGCFLTTCPLYFLRTILTKLSLYYCHPERSRRVSALFLHSSNNINVRTYTRQYIRAGISPFRYRSSRNDILNIFDALSHRSFG